MLLRVALLEELLELPGPEVARHAVRVEVVAHGASMLPAAGSCGGADTRVAGISHGMWETLLSIGVTLAIAGVLLWLIWPARTGAVAAGERGNGGFIPASGDSDGSGPVAAGDGPAC